MSSRLDVLDGNFLAALNAYATAAKQLEGSPLPQLLASLRTEVLNQVRVSGVCVFPTGLRVPCICPRVPEFCALSKGLRTQD